MKQLFFNALSIIVVVTSGHPSCIAQPSAFTYEHLNDSSFFSDTAFLYQFKGELDKIKQSGFRVVTILPRGYVKNGTIDYTKYIQYAIDHYSKLIFPPFPLLINDSGLKLHSHSAIYFPPGSKLLLAPSRKEIYEILDINGIKDVKLFFPVIQGDREIHIGNRGEWGMGINICGSRNVTIFSPSVSDCWGDGIYIGTGSNGTGSDSVDIYNSRVDNNRRNGISIINVKNLRMINVLASNTHGTLPMAGIDIEPNNNNEELENLHLENIYTINNDKDGIMILLEKLLSDTESPQEVTINIINHFDSNSGVSMYIGAIVDRSGKLVKNKIRRIPGNITILDPVWSGFSLRALSAWGYGVYGPPVYIINPVIRKARVDFKSVYLKDKAGLINAVDKEELDGVENNFRQEENIFFKTN
jgi:hypothetical protein